MGFELLRQRRRPPRAESTFLEVSRVLLAGLVLTSLTLTMLTGVRALGGRPLLDVGALLREGNGYVAAHGGLVIFSFTVEIVIALLLAAASTVLLAPAAARRIVHETGWHTVFDRTGSGYEVFLSVQMKDGTVITGYRADYSTEPDPAQRELILAPPLVMRSAGAAIPVPLTDEWQRVVLSGAEIATIAVAYVGQRDTPGADNARGLTPRLVHAHSWWAPLVAVGVVLVALLIVGTLT